MKLPAPDEYRIAMQNPRLAFADPDLKFAECEEDRWGLPWETTGGFAAIFHMHKGRSHWAIRCFYKDVPELRRRYDAIGQFVSKHADGVFVDAGLLHDGILVQGQRYPIIKMAWVAGDPLNLYIERSISKRQAISWLPDAFLELTKKLQTLGIAHGDLQHGNIMVTDHSLKLIDYDGLYLPELKGLRNNEQGHPNYQPPSRADEFGPSIDRFSEIVIYTALKAVVESPSLWKKYSNGENLLFKQNDFVDLDSSELMSDLEQISDLGSLVPKFEALCAIGIEDMPSLEDFLSGRWRPPIVVPPPTKLPPRPLRPLFEVLEASDTAGLLARVGHRVTVVGQIINIHEAVTTTGQPYAFLNFGDWRRDFHLVAWSGTLGLFSAEGLKISSYKGKWISITGILSSYKDRPQIEVEMPSQIEILSGMPEAMDRVKGAPPQKRRRKFHSDEMKGRELIKVRVFNYVAAHRDEYPSASTIASSLGVAVDAVTDVLEELVQQNKIRGVGPTSRAPGRQNVPPGFFPTSGGTRDSVPSGTFSSIPSVTGPTTSPNVMTRDDVRTLDRLYKTYQPSPPGPQSRPTVPPRTGQMIPSPGLFLGGILFVLMAIAVAVSRVYLLSFALAIAGLVVVVYALTHYSTLVPIQVMSHTSTTARLRGRCAGCGGAIQTGNQIVKTGRGWMHLRCTINAKKRVWKRV